MISPEKAVAKKIVKRILPAKNRKRMARYSPNSTNKRLIV